MYLNAEKVNRALDCSDNVLKALGITDASSSYLPVSIEEIQDYVIKTSGMALKKEEVIYPQGVFIKGRIHRYSDKRALIHVRRDQEPDWKRLVAAKELFELLVADTGDMCPYGDEILDALVFEGHIGIISPANAGDKGQSELISELAAMETLYPLVHQLEDLKDFHHGGPLTVGKLSLKYGIPEGTISTMLNSKYQSAIAKARSLR